MTQWFEAHTIATLRALPAGRADGRRRDRLRRHRPEQSPRSGFACASRGSPRCARQGGRRDRHARDRDRAVRGPAARRGAPRDRGRQDRAAGRPDEPFPTATAGPRILPPCLKATGAHPPTVSLTLYTDAFVIRGIARDPPAAGHRHPQQRRATRFLVLGDVTSDEFGTRGETIRAEFAQINLGVGPVRGRGQTGRDAARAAHAEGPGARRSSRSRRSRSPATSTCCRSATCARP